jgi:putative ABC transport system permease protein
MRGRALVVIVVATVAMTVLGGCAPPVPGLESRGPLILIKKADRPQASDLRESDVQALRDPARAPNVARVIPVRVGTAAFTTQQTVRAEIIGSTTEYLAAQNLKLALGDNFTDAQNMTRVAVIGPGLVTSLFGGDTRAAVGGTMRVAQTTFQIIGVVEHTGTDYDNAVIMPLNTVRTYLLGPDDRLNWIIVESTSTSTVKSVLDQVYAVLDTQHHISEPSARDYTAVIE